jgi:sodium/pantothenate symporter
MTDLLFWGIIWSVGTIFLLGAIGYGTRHYGRDASSYFVGGRRLNPMVISASWSATFLTGGAAIGAGGQAYVYGMGVSWLSLGTLLGSALSFTLVSFLIRELSVKYATLSVVETCAVRYRSGAVRIIGSLVVVVFMVAQMIAQYKATGVGIETITKIPYFWAIAITAVVFALTVLAGGMAFTVYADAALLFMMVGGMALLAAGTLYQIGGLEAIPAAAYADPEIIARSERFGVKNYWLHMVTSPRWVDFRTLGEWSYLGILGWILSYGISTAGSPAPASRYLALRHIDRKTYRGLVIWGGIFLFIYSVAMLLVAATTRAAMGTGYKGDPDMIVPLMAIRAFPPIISSLIILTLIFAPVTTVAVLIMQVATTISRDLIQKSFFPDLSDKSLVRVARWSTIVISGVAILAAAFKPPRFLSFFNMTAVVGLGFPFFFLILVGFFWKRANAAGAVACLVVNTITIFVTWGLLGWPYGMSTLTTLIFSGTAFFGGSLLWKPSREVDPTSQVEESLSVRA